MPLEGQWERQRTPLRGRELRVLSAIGAALAIAIVVAVVLSITGSTPAKAGCIAVTVPSTTGAATARACGSDAARYCRAQASATGRDAEATRKACRRAGF